MQNIGESIETKNEISKERNAQREVETASSQRICDVEQQIARNPFLVFRRRQHMSQI